MFAYVRNVSCNSALGLSRVSQRGSDALECIISSSFSPPATFKATLAENTLNNLKTHKGLKRTLYILDKTQHAKCYPLTALQVFYFTVYLLFKCCSCSFKNAVTRKLCVLCADLIMWTYLTASPCHTMNTQSETEKQGETERKREG